MRYATLLLIVVCGCATTTSTTGAPSGGTAGGADAGTVTSDAGMFGAFADAGGMIGDAGMADGGMVGADGGTMGAADGGMGKTPSVLTANLEPRSGSKVSGIARVTPGGSGVVVLVEVQNATPGEHGVHIHQNGDCSDPAAQSAGPHFNPNNGAHHGGANTPVRHGGDLGNMRVSSSGRGLLAVTVSDLTMDNAVGRAVVVHEKQDDLQSDPAGNSGARIACGVLQPAQ
jgi:Cu-Zn family superoxide dismutase